MAYEVYIDHGYFYFLTLSFQESYYCINCCKFHVYVTLIKSLVNCLEETQMFKSKQMAHYFLHTLCGSLQVLHFPPEDYQRQGFSL